MTTNADCTDVDVKELIPCSAMCCGITSCFCDFPECIGCKGEFVMCCFQSESAWCKKLSTKNPANMEGKICVCFEGECSIVNITRCCSVQEQVFCLDNRCSIPTNADIPCICTCLPFCTCCADWKLAVHCCKKIGDMDLDLVEPELKQPGLPQPVGKGGSTE
mmetsp:Transcript_14428/g.23664  ORF Transcript_14428/g.23664 Transcript_14428/m.23664 type:complete len:162 (-) Transcript_14428:276-761(-)|eukprot:CAMPEP_0169124432 /NCGR_PEP_ID=MMETSP1015-20121227/34321_1 /TAXON_ID=342587 /ORGANISM="Karlodinium micrum, Strain CCMP2283" /LENGTH=161 /DNA_ID=CAMNT_0009187847 /DNA_START=85 /DNA_END=570 /DNA_ORIENTATION=-